MRIRFNFATVCKHCGVKGNEFWLWEEEVKDKYICGNCSYKEVVLTKQLERVEIDPFKRSQ
jgi:Zn ribbon nucleic-acid-binding protein